MLHRSWTGYGGAKYKADEDQRRIERIVLSEDEWEELGRAVTLWTYDKMPCPSMVFGIPVEKEKAPWGAFLVR